MTDGQSDSYVALCFAGTTIILDQSQSKRNSYLVNTSSAMMTRAGEAVIVVILAQLALRARRTRAFEVIDKIVTNPAIGTGLVSAIILIGFAVYTLPRRKGNCQV